MFQVGEYVICSNRGVCVIEDVTALNISGVDKEKQYYILKPLYSAGSTVYVPVDSQKEPLMRRVLDRTEAERLIGDIPGIPLLAIPNDKLTEQTYKDCVKSNDCQELVKLIKTIHQHRQKRMQSGRKVTAVDAKYSHLAEDNLYGELAVALNMSREEVSGCVEAAIGGRRAVQENRVV